LNKKFSRSKPNKEVVLTKNFNSKWHRTEGEDGTALVGEPSPKGQIAIEIIMAVIVIFLLLIFVLIYNNSSLGATTFLKENNLQEIECNKVADAVSLVYGTSGNAELEIFVSSDFNTIGNSLEFGKAYCKSFGIDSDNVLQRGFVKIAKTNGVIVLENV